MALDTQRLFGIVRRQIDKMQETHQTLSILRRNGGLLPMDEEFLAKIEDWSRRIMGAVEGHGVEFETYHKHRIVKGRNTGFARGIADVVIGGDNDVFAKAIQSKSTVQKGDGAINTYLVNAFGQLAGTGNEKPRANDRPTILITIWDPSNTWPYTPGELRGGSPSLNNFKMKATEVVTQKISEYIRSHAMSMQFVNNVPVHNPITEYAKTFVTNEQQIQKNKLAANNLARPKSTPDYFSQTGQKLKTLLVKFKWPVDYACSDAFVHELSFVGIIQGERFHFHIEKENITRNVVIPPRQIGLNDLLNPVRSFAINDILNH